MNNEEVDAEILALLNAEATLKESLNGAPDVIHIPYMKARERFFVLINIQLQSNITSRLQILSVCISVFKIAAKSMLLLSEEGIEVAAYQTKNERSIRLMRLSVLSKAFAHMNETDADELLDIQAVDGVMCQWPQEKVGGRSY